MLLKINRLQNIIYYSSGPACNSSNPAGLKPARPEGLPARAAQQPSRVRCSPPCPGRNLGLGREFVFPPRPHSARQIVAIHFDRTTMRDFRGIKTLPAGRPSPNPSPFSSSFPLSPPNGAAVAEEKRWRWPPATARRWRRRLRCESPAGQPIYLPPFEMAAPPWGPSPARALAQG